MKHNTKIVLLSAAGVLLSAGNALVAGDIMAEIKKHENEARKFENATVSIQK